MLHELKCWPQFFQPILDRVKVCEMRRCDDRTFKVGEAIKLREFDPLKNDYTGRACCVWITHILGPFNADVQYRCGPCEKVHVQEERVPHVILSLSFMREDAIMASILADKPPASGL